MNQEGQENHRHSNCEIPHPDAVHCLKDADPCQTSFVDLLKLENYCYHIAVLHLKDETFRTVAVRDPRHSFDHHFDPSDWAVVGVGTSADLELKNMRKFMLT